MITVQAEAFRPFLDEVKPMLHEHWQELALDQEKVPLDPQYDEYLRRDAAGMALAVTVREEGVLVGYFVGFIAPGLHYRTCLTLTMDIFWVHPKARGAGAGFVLFKEVERKARERGVKRMFVGSKLHKDASWLFEKLGYVEVERYYSAWLGDATW
jgi:GNAT superfamily N-acetyltransferase